MMREIKFRGLNKLNKWIYGTGILFDGINHWIVSNKPNTAIYFGEEHHIILKESIGQYTGLKDKNGKEIFEGDIVIHKVKDKRTVVFEDGAFQTKRIISRPREIHDTFFFYGGTGKEWKIIGNIYENKDLLEEA